MHKVNAKCQAFSRGDLGSNRTKTEHFNKVIVWSWSYIALKCFLCADAWEGQLHAVSGISQLLPSGWSTHSLLTLPMLLLLLPLEPSPHSVNAPVLVSSLSSWWQQLSSSVLWSSMDYSIHNIYRYTRFQSCNRWSLPRIQSMRRCSCRRTSSLLDSQSWCCICSTDNIKWEKNFQLFEFVTFTCITLVLICTDNIKWEKETF